MDTDAHGLETNLTEAVIGSAFEVSKALGADSWRRFTNGHVAGSHESPSRALLRHSDGQALEFRVHPLPVAQVKRR